MAYTRLPNDVNAAVKGHGDGVASDHALVQKLDGGALDESQLQQAAFELALLKGGLGQGFVADPGDHAADRCALPGQS